MRYARLFKFARQQLLAGALSLLTSLVILFALKPLHMAPGRITSSSKKNEVKNGKVAKKSKTVMTLKEKIAVLDKLRSGTSYAACGREFQVNESTIRSIKKSEKLIRDAVTACPPATAKVTQHVRDMAMIKMEKALNIWIKDLNRRHIPVDSKAIREKATKLYEYYSQNTEDSSFKASKGWLEKFKKRYSLHNLRLTGESASADHEAAEKYQDVFEKMVQEKGYLPEQVFNADETGLFWKMPNRTFISKQERQAPGFKVAKDRVSVLLCSNAAGHMIKSLFLSQAVRQE